MSVVVALILSIVIMTVYLPDLFDIVVQIRVDTILFEKSENDFEQEIVVLMIIMTRVYLVAELINTNEGGTRVEHQ